MELSKSQIINLNDFKNIKDVLTTTDKHNPTGKALLFDYTCTSKDSLKMYAEIISELNKKFSDNLNLMTDIKNINNNEIGDINTELKYTLYQFSQISQWILNSYSVRNPNMNEFLDFDKNELKLKLKSIIRSLES
jgi:hypothetical protein